MLGIPKEVSDLITEAFFNHNDGWTIRGSKEKLDVIRNRISEFLPDPKVEQLNLLLDYFGEETVETILASVCSKCGRKLIVGQHLDYCNEGDKKVCMPCSGGS